MTKQPQVTDATRQAIVDAFWALYQKRSIDQISVRDIAEGAFVHRSTFYRYFNDIQDLLSQLEQKILDEIAANLRQIINSQALTDIMTHLDTAVEVMKDYAPIIYHLTGPNGDVQFRDKLRGELRGYFDQLPFVSTSAVEMDYLFHVVFNLMLSNLSFWYEHQDACAMEDVGGMCRKLFCDGAAQYIDACQRAKPSPNPKFCA